MSYKSRSTCESAKAKIASDRSGDTRKGVFCGFDLMYEDVPFEKPASESVVAPRTPTDDALIAADRPSYMYVSEDLRDGDCIEIKECSANANHVTLSYYKALHVGLEGGPRLSPFLPAWTSRCVVISEEQHTRLQRLTLKGARLNHVTIGDNPLDLKDVKLWSLQFIGRARERPPKFVDNENQCPRCGRGKIVCEACGYWIPLCENCGKEMYINEDVRQQRPANSVWE